MRHSLVDTTPVLLMAHTLQRWGWWPTPKGIFMPRRGALCVGETTWIQLVDQSSRPGPPNGDWSFGQRAGSRLFPKAPVLVDQTGTQSHTPPPIGQWPP